MNSCELVAYISTLACTISRCCSTEEVTLLAVVFTQLCDTLATILTQEELCEAKQEDTRV